MCTGEICLSRKRGDYALSGERGKRVECRSRGSSEAVAEMLDRITHNPNVLAGRAGVRGLRVSVAHIVNLVANGMTPEEIVEDIPELELEDIRQALAYAASIADDRVYPITATQ